MTAARRLSGLESAPLVLTLPMPPNIANGSHGHWRTRENARRVYLGLLDTLQAAGEIAAPPRRAFVRASIDSVMHLANYMDQDNAMRRHKWPLDWLRTRGYLTDDSRKHLTWKSFPEQHVKRDGNYRIIITLSPLTETPHE